MKNYPSSIIQFKEFVELKDYRGPTKEKYVSSVWKLAQHFGCDPARLSENQLRQYFLFLREERQCSPSMMKIAKWSLRCFYRDHLKLTGWKVFEDLRIAEPQTLPLVLSRGEVQQVLGAVRELRFATCLRLMYHCGLRVSEAASLQVRDVLGRQSPPRLHIRDGKGGKDRYVPLAPAMVEELRQWWRTHQHPQWLFPSKGEPLATTPMSAAAVQEVFRQARQASGIQADATTHTLRHSYATHLLEEGVSLRQISAYLGHQSLDTTVIYTHLTAMSEARTQAALQVLYQPRQG
jgi:site-specific recombinase XerD